MSKDGFDLNLNKIIKNIQFQLQSGGKETNFYLDIKQ